MAPVAGTNRVRKPPENPVHLPKEQQPTPPPPPPPQTDVVDAASRLTRLSDSRLSGAMKKVSLQRQEPQPPPQVPQPPSPNQPDRAVDGHLLGADGTVPPNTPLKDVNAVTPQGGVRNNETVIYTNGILTNTEAQKNSLQAIADQTGSRVIGVRNATAGGNAAGDVGLLGKAEGFLRDADQTINDKFGIGRNPAVDTLADTVYTELRAGRSPHLMAHSQGGAITSRALSDVKNRLMAEDGMSRQDAEKLMGNAKVETFAAAASTYPDGPQYVHYINRNDAVPQTLGVGDWVNPLTQPGKGAVTHYFRDGAPAASHGFEDFYLGRRVPFEEARQGNFKEPEALALPNQIANSVIDAGKFAGEKLFQGGKFVAEKAFDAGRFVGEKAVEGINLAKEKVTQARQLVGEKVTQARQFAGEKVAQAKDFIGEKFTQTRQFVGDKIAQARRSLGEGLTAAKDYAAQKIDQTKTVVEVGFNVVKSLLPWN